MTGRVAHPPVEDRGEQLGEGHPERSPCRPPRGRARSRHGRRARGRGPGRSGCTSEEMPGEVYAEPSEVQPPPRSPASSTSSRSAARLRLLVRDVEQARRAARSAAGRPGAGTGAGRAPAPRRRPRGSRPRPGCSSTTRVNGSSSGCPGAVRRPRGARTAARCGRGPRCCRPASSRRHPATASSHGRRLPFGHDGSGATPASLTQQEARDRAALIEVERYDIRVDVRELARRRPVAGHLARSPSRCRAAGRLDVRRLRRRRAVRDAQRRRARPRRPWPRAGSRCPGWPPTTSWSSPRCRPTPGRGDAILRSVDPSGQAGLRLVVLRAGRRQARLGVLRPARPQGRARLPGQRARRSGRCSATPRPRWCSTATTAAGSGSSRTRRGSRRTSSWSTPGRSTSSASSAATTASASTAVSRSRPTSSGTPRSCSGSPSRGWPSSASGSRMPFPQERYDQVFVPDMGGAMENWGCVTWSDCGAAPQPTDLRAARLHRHWCCCTRWRTCGSGTW